MLGKTVVFFSVLIVAGVGLLLALHHADGEPVKPISGLSDTHREDRGEEGSPPRAVPPPIETISPPIETIPLPVETPVEALIRQARAQEEARRHDEWMLKSMTVYPHQRSMIRDLLTAEEDRRLRALCDVSPAERELVASVLRAAEGEVRSWTDELARLCVLEVERRDQEGQYVRREFGMAESFAEVTRLGLDALVDGNPRSGLFAYRVHSWSQGFNERGEEISHTRYFDLRSGSDQRWLEERRHTIRRVEERISRLFDELSALHTPR